MNCPRLVIAGTHSGVGKTTVAAGLLAALGKRAVVQPFKVGPDYIDPAYHTILTGRKSRNLDDWLLPREVLLYLFRKNMQGANLAVVEGVMGLFDGCDPSGETGSTAQVARILQAPVILVVDGSGMSTSGAALVQGYQGFQKGLDLVGVILNKVGGAEHYLLLKEAIETYSGVKVYGYLPAQGELELPSRHLGLVPSGEIAGLADKLDFLAQTIEKTIDVEGLYELARQWKKELPETVYYPGVSRGKEALHLAVAYDEAFNFYYWDNLELLEEMGARLSFFSPLRDRQLPEPLHGLILGGGFPEVFAGALSANKEMRRSIKTKLEQGLPYYAECGGLMYLLEHLVDQNGNRYEMTAWLKGESRMTPALQRFGYACLSLRERGFFGEKGDKIRIHEFHCSEVKLAEELPALFSLTRPGRSGQVASWECGYQKGNGVAGYPHLHFYSNIDFARNMLNFIYSCRQNQKGQKKGRQT